MKYKAFVYNKYLLSFYLRICYFIRNFAPTKVISLWKR